MQLAIGNNLFIFQPSVCDTEINFFRFNKILQMYLFLIRASFHLLPNIRMHLLGQITFFLTFLYQFSRHVNLDLGSLADPLHHCLVLSLSILLFLLWSRIIFTPGLCVN